MKEDWLELIELIKNTLIKEFVEDLKESDNILYKMEGYYQFNRDIIKKWEEKLK